MARPILLGDMPHMIEARSIEDDWAGVSDLAARKKRQNRLNQRALSRCQDHVTATIVKHKAHGRIGRRREAIRSAQFQKETTETFQSGLPLNIARQHSSHAIRLDMHSAWNSGQQAVLEQVEHQPAHLAKPYPLSRTPNGNSPLRFGWVSDEEGTVLAVSLGPTTIVLDLYSCSLPADHLLSLQRYNLYRACATIVEILG